MDFWTQHAAEPWRQALGRYDDVIARQGVTRLPELDRWYQRGAAAADRRACAAARHARGARARHRVEDVARRVARAEPRARARQRRRAGGAHERARRSRRCRTRPSRSRHSPTLAGVGPATASAVAAAAAPDVYPFFDELVAAQVPTLGPVKFTASYYARYADALRGRATSLGHGWTPAAVERALWADVGGKAGIPQHGDAT